MAPRSGANRHEAVAWHPPTPPRPSPVAQEAADEEPEQEPEFESDWDSSDESDDPPLISGPQGDDTSDKVRNVKFINGRLYVILEFDNKREDKKSGHTGIRQVAKGAGNKDQDLNITFTNLSISDKEPNMKREPQDNYDPVYGDMGHDFDSELDDGMDE